jgi:hypothetical protein
MRAQMLADLALVSQSRSDVVELCRGISSVAASAELLKILLQG